MPLLLLAPLAESQYLALKKNPALKIPFKAVQSALDKMAANLRHPSLQTHEYSSFAGPAGEKVYEVYAPNKTPGAYRIFFYFGPERGEVTILAIAPHP